MKTSLPHAEAQRLRALRNYNVLDTPPEAELDELTSLAAQICQTPIAMISFVDETRQWFKSRHGIDLAEAPRAISFCTHAILDHESVMEVPDALADPRFADNELVVNAPNIRFYAGAPLVSPDGHAIGTLCVIDRKPLRLDAAQTAALRVLSRNVVMHLESRQFNIELRKNRQETGRLLALAEKSRAALLSVLEDEQQSGKRLRESEARFRELAENIDEFFWIADPRKRQFLYISPAYETIWQQTCASLYEAPGNWLDSIHPDDRPHVEAAADLRAGSGHDETYRILRPDGSVRWIRDRAFPVRDGHGETLRIVGTAMDVTESKHVEELCLRAQRMESIGTLAGGIAHDINNVLAPILMSIELLKTHEHDTERLEILRTIGSCAKRGADLIGQLRSFARGVEGVRLSVDVGELLGKIEKIVAGTFMESIRLSCAPVPSGLWIVQGDSAQLHQVLMNLCVNARDAMPEGGELSLAADNLMLGEHQCAGMHPAARPGPYVQIVVGDSGVGMSPEVVERIFEPFFTTKDVGKGTGLGLSTSVGIIKSHGGFMQVESELGKGSRIHVFLPARLVP